VKKTVVWDNSSVSQELLVVVKEDESWNSVGRSAVVRVETKLTMKGLQMLSFVKTSSRDDICRCVEVMSQLVVNGRCGRCGLHFCFDFDYNGNKARDIRRHSNQ